MMRVDTHRHVETINKHIYMYMYMNIHDKYEVI